MFKLAVMPRKLLDKSGLFFAIPRVGRGGAFAPSEPPPQPTGQHVHIRIERVQAGWVMGPGAS